ncbi:MAG: hypothetical protein GF350_03280 [Chitinivibrionales bacterium]|nr:hypothetical protein [Chitinivibrionales bacterium]
MNNDRDIEKLVTDCANEQLFGVLATRCGDCLHTSIVAFAASESLNEIVFATPESSRKYANLTGHPSVSLFIDNRQNDASRLYDITGITIPGTASIVDPERDAVLVQRYIDKHPGLRGFIESRSTKIIRIDVDRYDIVTKFRKVQTLHVEKG